MYLGEFRQTVGWKSQDGWRGESTGAEPRRPSPVDRRRQDGSTEGLSVGWTVCRWADWQSADVHHLGWDEKFRWAWKAAPQPQGWAATDSESWAASRPKGATYSGAKESDATCWVATEPAATYSDGGCWDGRHSGDRLLAERHSSRHRGLPMACPVPNLHPPKKRPEPVH